MTEESAALALQRDESANPATVQHPGTPTVDGKPEPDLGVSSELSDSPAGSDSATRVFGWLKNHADKIAGLESQFGVDRRAIAGAVAWEALRNPRSRIVGATGRYVGAGKPHVKSTRALPAFVYTGENVPEEVERAGLLPKQTVGDRERLLEKDSLPYIAAGMRLGAHITRRYGKDISADPAMLTWFWVSKDALKLIDHMSSKQDDKFEPTAEAMPKWVMENLGWLSRAVGECGLRKPGGGVAPEKLPKVGEFGSDSWSGSYSIKARLPESRDFLVTGGQVTLTIDADTDYIAAMGYSVFVVLHRRTPGSNVEVDDAKRFGIGTSTTFSWSKLPHGLYFFEIFSFNGIPVHGNLQVNLSTSQSAAAHAGPSTGSPAMQRLATTCPSAAVGSGSNRAVLALQRWERPSPVAEPGPYSDDMGLRYPRPPLQRQAAAPPRETKSAPDAGQTPPDPAQLRAAAARALVQQLQDKKAVYGHELADTSGPPGRKEGWWWEETEFDCSKFVLWVLAGRRVGDAPPDPKTSKHKAIRQVKADPFGAATEASSVSAMMGIADSLVKEGKTKPIDPARLPRVGDLMFWGGHVALVVEVTPTKDDNWVVYADMGTHGAELIGVDSKGQHWLKVSDVAKRPELAAGTFKGYWTP